MNWRAWGDWIPEVMVAAGIAAAGIILVILAIGKKRKLGPEDWKD